jgi:hypothetical protein
MSGARGSAWEDERVSAVTRLLTRVDVAGPDARTVAVTARLDAVLADGRRVVLLDDRGWSGSGGWAHETAAEIERTARFVVGPDEPFEGHSQALRHDVELSDDVLARIGRDPRDAR